MYSTRPKRGPIEARGPRWDCDRRHCIPRVLSVAPLKLDCDDQRIRAVQVFHAS